MFKSSTRAGLFLSALTVSCALAFPSLAYADGVEFQPVPIDVSKRCSSMVLQGTSRFAGTAYVVPKILISIDKSGNRLFEVLPIGNDDYVLRFALYLPYDINEALSLRGEDPDFITHGCDLNEIRSQLGRADSAAAAKAQNGPVLRLTPLPIQKITVRIDGLEQPYVVGSEHSDALDYFGLDKIVEFKLHGKEQLEWVLRRIRGEIGLGVAVDIGFAARSSSNYLSIKVDTTAVAKDLEAKLKGRVSIVSTDLAAAVADSLRSMNLNIYEEGESDAFDQLAQSLIGQLGNNVFAQKNAEVASSGLAGTVKDAMPGYDMAATLKVLRERQSLNLVRQKMGAIEQKTFTTSTILRADVASLDSSLIPVSSERGWITAPGRIAQGQQLVLSIDRRVQKNLSLSLEKHWFSKSTLRQSLAELTAAFPAAGDIDFGQITDKETTDGFVAQYVTRPNFWNRLLPGAYTPNHAVRRLSWGYNEWTPRYIDRSDAAVELSPEMLAGLPIEFSFSEVGTRLFKAAELAQASTFFEGTYDREGEKIVLTATRDLGNMKVRNVESIPVERRVLKQFFEKDVYPTCFTCSSPVIKMPGAEEPLRRFQSEYMLNVRHPESLIQLNIKPETSQDKAVIIP